jgi:hypothetical protein
MLLNMADEPSSAGYLLALLLLSHGTSASPAMHCSIQATQRGSTMINLQPLFDVV